MARQARVTELATPGEPRRRRAGPGSGGITGTIAASKTTGPHLKHLLVHHQVILPSTRGRLDLGRWQAVFYAAFDGRRDKRLVIDVMGEL